MLSIVEALDNELVAEARRLFIEYSVELGVDLSFQDFDEEIQNLPGEYSPPKGCILLALDDSSPVGCIAIRPISQDICEMKRLYVSPEKRGTGIGRKLVSELIIEARKKGYRKMRLDTLSRMKEAVSLYKSFGFTPIPPYRYNPLKGAVFLELDIN